MRLFVLALALAAASQSAPPSMRTVGKGPMSAIDEPRQVTVRSSAEWSALWMENGAGPPTPMVDFPREMIVGVFLGPRPTAGYGVEIVRTIVGGGALLVEYVETTPPPGTIAAQVLTSPYHLVAIPTHAGAVTFKKVDK
jgi:hypothetical protein